jgi:hypothetical protein
LKIVNAHAWINQSSPLKLISKKHQFISDFTVFPYLEGAKISRLCSWGRDGGYFCMKYIWSGIITFFKTVIISFIISIFLDHADPKSDIDLG